MKSWNCSADRQQQQRQLWQPPQHCFELLNRGGGTWREAGRRGFYRERMQRHTMRRRSERCLFVLLSPGPFFQKNLSTWLPTICLRKHKSLQTVLTVALLEGVSWFSDIFDRSIDDTARIFYSQCNAFYFVLARWCDKPSAVCGNCVLLFKRQSRLLCRVTKGCCQRKKRGAVCS